MSRSVPLRPFFIVGSPRSGTTLLRFMLSSHSRLYVPHETGFIPFLRCDSNQQLSLEDVAGVLARIGQLNRFWAGMVPDVASFYAVLPQPKLAYVLDALYKQRIAIHGARRWGDKTPLYVRFIPYLRAIFPQAKFIHIIRDGRDASLSARQKWGVAKPYMDLYYLLLNWRRNVQAGQEAQRQLSDQQYCEVRYESLVQTPESIMQQLCAFLNEQFEPGMLDHTRLAHKVGIGIDEHTEVQHRLYTSSVARWKVEMSPFEKKMADDIVGDKLIELDYPLAKYGSMTVHERVRMFTLFTKFLLTDSTRSLLYRLGVLTLNRNLRA